MRAHEITPPSDDWDELQRIIDTQCTDSFGTGSKPMFRGAYNRPNNFLGTIRTDRQLRDSGSDEGWLFDLYMQAHGWPHRKSNTLSVTTDKIQANMFGRTYIIYPFNGSQYVGSTKITDFQKVPMRVNQALGAHLNLGWSDYSNLFLSSYDNPTEFINQMVPHLEAIDEHTGMFGTSNAIEATSKAVGEIIVFGSKYVALIDPR